MHNLITISIVFTKKFFFFFRPKNLMNLYSKTFYILNFQKKKKIHGKVNPKLGIYRWVSGFGQGERYLVKRNKNTLGGGT